MSIFSRFRQSLEKTGQGFKERVLSVFGSKTRLDAALLEDLEEALIAADVGPGTSMMLVEQVQEDARDDSLSHHDPQQLLKRAIMRLLETIPQTYTSPPVDPRCILVVGVNGVGKTTTIAKLAKLHQDAGDKVLLAAADTFRAAATEQLDTWANRIGCDIVKHKQGSDPAAVVFDAVSAAKARGTNTIIVDTAGRLHTRINLMNELKKIHRVVSKELSEQALEVLLVLDANTGQNALAQARVFGEATPLSGIVITKLDSTAKGGMVLGVVSEMGVPIKYVTTGESVGDIALFDPQAFVQALFE